MSAGDGRVACRRWLISGRVQGVFFRAATRDRARALELRGTARNLADGRVEVIACGADDALDRLRAWLHQGSPAARVDAVMEEPWSGVPPVDFTTG